MLPESRDKNNRNYQIFLFVVFALVWIWSGWSPASPENWFLENSIVFLVLPIILLISRYVQISRLSLSLITLFLIFHVIGSHYNYGSVPFGITLGGVLGTGGNIYDKFVHFSFGFLIAYPVFEVVYRILNIKSFWNYFISFNIILSWSAFYEMIEWVNVFRIGDSHLAYLYIGGNDPFDTTKDMAIAGLGALCALGLTVFFRSRMGK